MAVSLQVSELQAKHGKIPRIPLLLKYENNQNDDYDPKVVSLGPYHYGKEHEHLKFVENFKPKALQMFIRSENDEENFHDAILNKIEDARSCYVDEFRDTITDSNFARMMLLDACFILNDIEISTSWPDAPQASTKKHKTIHDHLGKAVYSITRRDLYLLENQVPFWILDLLVSLRYGNEKAGKVFREVVEKYCYEMFFEKQGEEQHLKSMREYYANAESPSHLLEIFRRVVLPGKYQSVERYGRYVFRSVTDLKSKGIDFKPSNINCLKTGVSFSSAVLSLPRWYVTIYTKVFFKNMIAYEFHPFSTDKDNVVIAYINFMKSLVNTSNDVKELREKKIMYNSLGSDEEVVQVYNSLHTYGADDPYLFQDVKWYITQHCESKWKTWFAEFKSDYFKSPWSAIAFVAGILLFIFNIVQIYYAIKGDDKPNGSGSGSRPGSRL